MPSLATSNGRPGPTHTTAGSPIDVTTTDQIVAVGPDDVMQAAWPATLAKNAIRITDRSGGALIQEEASAFFASPQLGLLGGFDTRVAYDASHGRWVAMATQIDCEADHEASHGHGYLHLAISATADPRDAWDVYRWTYINAWPLNPGLGTSGDKLVLTTEVHEIDAGCVDTPVGWDMTVVEFSDVMASASFQEDYYFLDQADIGITALRPSIQQPATNPVLQLVGQVDDAIDGTAHLWQFTVSGPVPGSLLEGYDLTADELIGPFGPTTDAQNGGGGPPALSLKGGPTTAVWHNGRLAVVGTDSCTPSGDSQVRACARVVELDASTAPASVVQDVDLGYKGMSTFDPGVAWSGAGDLFVTLLRSSGTTPPSSSAVLQRSDDANGSFSSPVTVFSSTTAWETGMGAALSQTAADPQDSSSVWTASLASSSTSGYARTRLIRLTTATGDTYAPIDPLRVLDTRDGTGLSGKFQTGVPRTFAVAGAGGGAIPADAVAITGNLTVTGQGSAGYVSVGPSVSANPATSTINFPLGDNRANNLTLPLDAAGKLMAVFKGGAGKSTQLILDVTGYFTADDAGATYKPLTAARVLDTRTGAGLSGKFATNVPRTFQVTGHGGVPASATAVTGNLTVVGQTRAGYVSLTPDPVANPDTSTLNFPVGDTRANGLTLPLSAAGRASAVYKATTAGTTDLIFDVTGYYVAGTSGLRFFPLSPGRIMDSRMTALTQLTGAFSSSVPRTLVTGGHFGVPGDALAVSGNLTVVGQTKAGYVSITKDPTANPAVSTLNFPAGDVRANGTTVPLNAANDMAIVYKATAGAKTHLILDVTGYFR